MTKCQECGSTSLLPSAVPGLGACQHCGRLSPAPELWAQAAAAIKADEAADPLELADFSDEIPDSIECAMGWRAWGIKPLDHKGEVPILQSARKANAAWTPRIPMVARCDRHEGDQIPGNDHCGLYAAKTLEHLLSMPYPSYDAEKHGKFGVIGKVKFWGEVIEGSQGWRAQYGYPEKLWVPYEAWHLAGPLTEAYGVEVKLKNFLKDE